MASCVLVVLNSPCGSAWSIRCELQIVALPCAADEQPHGYLFHSRGQTLNLGPPTPDTALCQDKIAQG